MTEAKSVRIGELAVSNAGPLTLIAGPCQLEGLDHALRIAEVLAAACAADRHGPDLQELLRQGQPHLARGGARHGHGGRPEGARRGARAHRLPGPDRRAPARRLRPGGGGRGRAADPRLPQPPDRPPAGRGRDRRRDQRQEGPVPRPLGHGQRRRQDRLHRQRAHPALRARRLLRLQHPGRRHAQPADHGAHRLSGGDGRDPFGAAAGRPGHLLRRPARVRPGHGPRRRRGRRGRGLHRDPPRPGQRPLRRAEHDPARPNARGSSPS